MMRSLILISAFILSMLFLAGCSAPVKKSEITPTTVTSYQPTGKTISLLPVQIREQPKPGLTSPLQDMPTPQVYRDCLIGALIQTGAFSHVLTDGASDYSLSADVIGERLLGSMNNISMILIRYRLVDNHSGSTIWEKNIFPHSVLSAQQVFMGTERLKRVLGNAVKDNITQATTLVGETLSSRQ